MDVFYDIPAPPNLGSQNGLYFVVLGFSWAPFGFTQSHSVICWLQSHSPHLQFQIYEVVWFSLKGSLGVTGKVSPSSGNKLL
ncbi:hypothetical protein H5410_032127 [Solanum commersonii]|uniref:Uncharacterized protein n=1 Tax=Solanum commersonii TaxID=4109 RepID=A0A9J5YL87_SOLCO|nr:hypothetical protein H5410_032127 [Solanum commersonii]